MATMLDDFSMFEAFVYQRFIKSQEIQQLGEYEKKEKIEAYLSLINNKDFFEELRFQNRNNK